MKKVNKLVFISSIAVPYQVRFCDSLQEYYESRFWFSRASGSHSWAMVEG